VITEEATLSSRTALQNKFNRKKESKMKIDPGAKCNNCGASHYYVDQGRREYVIPWGEYLLCDKCHRLAIMEALRPESKSPLKVSG